MKISDAVSNVALSSIWATLSIRKLFLHMTHIKLPHPRPEMIPSPDFGDIPLPPSFWPRNRAGIIDVAKDWYLSGHVYINQEKIVHLESGTITPVPESENILGSTLSGSNQKYLSQAEASIVIGSINHMFWEVVDREFIRYEHQGQVGALAMTGAIERAWNNPDSALWKARHEGIPLTEQSIKEVFGDIPAPKPRVAILNQILLSDQLPHLAEVAQRIGQAGDPLGVEFAARLADTFPLGYGDELLKKAQLTTSWLWRQARACGSVSPCDVTAFADYQIPNVLRAMGILTYEPELAERIDRGELIAANGPDERCIRAASILAVDMLSKQQRVDVADVDYWLWLRRKEATAPFHRTRTTLY